MASISTGPKELQVPGLANPISFGQHLTRTKRVLETRAVEQDRGHAMSALVRRLQKVLAALANRKSRALPFPRERLDELGTPGAQVGEQCAQHRGVRNEPWWRRWRTSTVM